MLVSWGLPLSLSSDKKSLLSDDEMGDMVCSDLDMPLFKSECVASLFSSYINMALPSWELWELVMDGRRVRTEFSSLLSSVIKNIVDVISTSVFQVVKPQVVSHSGLRNENHNYRYVTEEDILASFDTAFHLGLETALGLRVKHSYITDKMLQLLAAEVTNILNQLLDSEEREDSEPKLCYMHTREMVELLAFMLMLAEKHPESCRSQDAPKDPKSCDSQDAPEYTESCGSQPEPEDTESCDSQEHPESCDSQQEPDHTESCDSQPEPEHPESCDSQPEPEHPESCDSQDAPEHTESCDSQPERPESCDSQPEHPEACDSQPVHPESCDSQPVHPVSCDSQGSARTVSHSQNSEDSDSDTLLQRDWSFVVVFCSNLLIHILDSNALIYDVDFFGIIVRLGERTVGELGPTLPKNIKKVQIAVYKTLCCEYGSANALLAAMFSDSNFEEKVYWVLKEEVQKPEPVSFLDKMRSLFKKRTGRVYPKSTVSDHQDSVNQETGSTPSSSRKQKPPPNVRKFLSIARFFKKP